MTSKTNRDTCEHLFVPAYWRQAVPDYDRCTKCGLLDHYPKEPRMSREEAAKIVSEYAAKETRETREEEVSRLKSEHSLALEKVRKELFEIEARLCGNNGKVDERAKLTSQIAERDATIKNLRGKILVGNNPGKLLEFLEYTSTPDFKDEVIEELQGKLEATKERLLESNACLKLWYRTRTSEPLGEVIDRNNKFLEPITP